MTTRELDTSTKLMNLTVVMSIFVLVPRDSCISFFGPSDIFRKFRVRTAVKSSLHPCLRVSKGVMTDQADHSNIVEVFFMSHPHFAFLTVLKDCFTAFRFPIHLFLIT